MTFVIKVDEEEECLPTVLSLLGQQKFIRVDGHSGVGKTRIAKALASELGWNHVRLDDFLDKADTKSRYENRVLVNDVIARISDSSNGVILDGLWLDHLIQRDIFGPELRIYMRASFAPEFDNDEKRRRAKLGTEIYHRRYDPARWADLVIMKIAIF
ncbi:hypothetical protein [Rhizobium leguminosarum]|uniref:hypothetical protein n=1 Tax=Rhizobium leguminosarum TaxID=384 RepID=UPI001C971D6B|nr:hypothetical protein [Rhizobium leguminosarum]MBY5374180.1 hypothetical protein [Rhizobium leguminosarum]